jgi:hypothetical protein
MATLAMLLFFHRATMGLTSVRTMPVLANVDRFPDVSVSLRHLLLLMKVSSEASELGSHENFPDVRFHCATPQR